ncbi:hypothetical protein ROZALSC1DRAFT_28718, partial [Rozella allomycis CSF55]
MATIKYWKKAKSLVINSKKSENSTLHSYEDPELQEFETSLSEVKEMVSSVWNLLSLEEREYELAKQKLASLENLSNSSTRRGSEMRLAMKRRQSAQEPKRAPVVLADVGSYSTPLLDKVDEVKVDPENSEVINKIPNISDQNILSESDNVVITNNQEESEVEKIGSQNTIDESDAEVFQGEKDRVLSDDNVVIEAEPDSETILPNMELHDLKNLKIEEMDELEDEFEEEYGKVLELEQEISPAALVRLSQENDLFTPLEIKDCPIPEPLFEKIEEYKKCSHESLSDKISLLYDLVKFEDNRGIRKSEFAAFLKSAIQCYERNSRPFPINITNVNSFVQDLFNENK